jgi:hypothetical protein
VRGLGPIEAEEGGEPEGRNGFLRFHFFGLYMLKGICKAHLLLVCKYFSSLEGLIQRAVSNRIPILLMGCPNRLFTLKRRFEP